MESEGQTSGGGGGEKHGERGGFREREMKRDRQTEGKRDSERGGEREREFLAPVIEQITVSLPDLVCSPLRSVCDWVRLAAKSISFCRPTAC